MSTEGDNDNLEAQVKAGVWSVSLLKSIYSLSVKCWFYNKFCIHCTTLKMQTLKFTILL